MPKFNVDNDAALVNKAYNEESVSYNKIKPSRKRKRTSSFNEENTKKVCKTDYPTKDFVNSDFEDIQITQEKNTDNKFAVNIKLVKNHAFLTASDKISSDFFMTTNAQHSYVNFINKDVVFQIFDEICLEGLDGITIEGFWKRLQQGLGSKFELDEFIKNIIWHIICQNKEINFFILNDPRPILTIFEPNEVSNINLETAIKIGNASNNLYPYHLVKTEDIIGSCSTFESQSDITENIRNMSLEHVLKKYDNRLIMVASQRSRLRAIFNESTDPEIVKDLQPIEYCILEMVGRSRTLGEISSGPGSLATRFNLEGQTIFHHEKQLFLLNLIKKQVSCMKDSSTDQNRMGRLIHLSRFYKKYKSKQLIITEQIINILREMKDHRIDYDSLRKYFPNFKDIKKLMKSSEFKKFCSTNMTLIYKDVYPNSLPDKWYIKNGNIRQVKMIELKDPTINVVACWNNYEDENEEENEIEDDVGDINFNREIICDVYEYLAENSTKDITMLTIKNQFGLDLYTVRKALRKLIQKNIVRGKSVDVGKQRVQVFTACYPFNKDGKTKHNYSGQWRHIMDKVIKKQTESGQITSENNFATEDVRNMFGSYFTIDFEPFQCQYFCINENINCSTIKALRNACPILTFVKVKKKVKITVNDNLYKTLKNCDDIYITLKDKREYVIAKIISLKYVFKWLDKPDVITKWILLRRMFKEIFLNDENTINFLSGQTTKTCKRKLNENVNVNGSLVYHTEAKKESNDSTEFTFNDSFLEDWKADISSNNLNPKKNALDFMGPNPKMVISEEVNGITTKIMVSSPPQKYVCNVMEYKSEDTVLTDRILSRLNIILKTLHEQKIIDDHTKMLKIVQDIEKKSGYSKTIDRKTIYRLYRRLVEEGYIQFFKVIICDDNIIKNHLFICLPTIKYNHSIIQSTIDQIRMRYFLADQRQNIIKLQKSQKSPFQSADILESVEKLHELNKNDNKLQDCYYKNAGHSYGYSPKFLRLQIIHEFLFYMIYEHENQIPLNEVQVTELFQNYNIQLSNDDLKNMPPIYYKELSWKMFIPPLPQHKGWCKGWALVCDLLIRLPVSVLVRVHNVPFIVPELRDLLSHPIKTYSLLTQISSTIRSPLLYKRIYISRISEILNQLAFMGLVQMGPKKFKEKDQRFVYLNKQATLFDTSTSEPGYHKTTEKEYPQFKFVLNSMMNVEKYWHTLYMIGRNTKLNMRNIMAGKTITILDASANADLQKALKSRLAHEAVHFDNGEIPGDGRGAAGLDSSLWVHILKNWMKPSKRNVEKKIVVGLKSDMLSKATSIMPYENIRNLSTYKKIILPTKSIKNQKTKNKVVNYGKTNQRKRNRKKMVRKIKAKPKKICSAKVTPVAKSRCNKVSWDIKEDKLLLILKAMSIFLCQKSTKQIISYYAIRDVLHIIYPKSRNKNVFVIIRRIKKLISEHKYSKHVKHNFNNFLKIDVLSKYFFQLIDSSIYNSENIDKASLKLSKTKLTIAFIYMAAYIKEHLKEVENLIFGRASNADFIYLNRIEDLQIFEAENTESLYGIPTCEEDIRKDIVKSILYSSLNSETVGSYELFHVYQHFNDTLIRQAVMDMRKHQMISGVKSNADKDRPKNALPFQFSSNYLFSIVSTFSESTAEETFNTITQLSSGSGHLNLNLATSGTISQSVIRKRYGQLLAINELFTKYPDIQFEIDIPEVALKLNPEIKDYSAIVNELAIRWQLKFERLQKIKAQESIKDNQHGVFKLMEMSEGLNEASTSSMENVIDIQFNSAKEINHLKDWAEDNSINSVKNNDSMEYDVLRVIPALDEIKEGMMQPYTPEEVRLIPHITDMINLLGRDEFPELNTDDETLEEYKKYFIPVYPNVESIRMDNIDVFEKSLSNTISEKLKNENVIKCLNRSYVIIEPQINKIMDLIKENGGDDADYKLALDIIEFVKTKNILGATPKEIRTNFPNITGCLFTWQLIDILLESNVILKVGICNFVFIHHSNGKHWTIEAQPISNVKLGNVDKNMFVLNPFANNTNMRLIRIMPWSCVDGLLNIKIFKKFLCLIFSHCIEHPKITLKTLFSTYCYVKPVDIYYLLETLQTLGCIQLKAYVSNETSLFSNWSCTEERVATVLDDFNDQFVEPTFMPMVSLGMILNKL